MTTVTKPNLVPPGPVPAWTGPAAWVPLVHYVIALAGAALVAAHSTFHLTALIQAVILVASAGLVVVGTLVYFLERKASLASMAAYLRSVVPDILTVLDEAKGPFPTLAARIEQGEAAITSFAPAAHAIADLVPGRAAAQGATTVTPLPITVAPVAPPVAVPAPEPTPVPTVAPAPAEAPPAAPQSLP